MAVETAGGPAEPPRTRPVARATAAPMGGPAAYLAELIGTFALVFFVTMIVVIHSGDGLGVTDWAVLGLVHAFVLMLLIHSLGSASGAHFNPAVTVALLVGRKIRPPDALIYIVVQLIGALLAALLTKALLQNEGSGVNFGALAISDAPEAPAATPGAPAPPATGPDFLGGSAIGGLAVEAIGGFFLMWSIMAMLVNPRGERHWAAWVIGATLGLLVMTLGPLTGGGFNPARWFGPALVGGEWADLWVFLIGPILGAILAYMAYTAVILTPQGRSAERPIDVLD